MAGSPHQAYDVYIGRKWIDTVFYSASLKVPASEVRESLVNHDGYDPRIKVIKRRMPK